MPKHHHTKTREQSEGTEKRKHRHHPRHRHEEQAQQQEPVTAVEQSEQPATRSRSNAVGPKQRPDLEVISNPEWYTGLKERLNEFGQYNNAFAGTKENLAYTADLDHLDAIEAGAHSKKAHLDALFDKITELHEDMLNDPGNADKKAEGENFYDTCCKKKAISEQLYADLLSAVTDRKKAVQNEQNKMQKQQKRSSVRARLQALQKDSPMMQLIRRVKAMESGAAPDTSGVKTTKTAGLMDWLSEDVQEGVNSLMDTKETVEESVEGGDQMKSFIEGIQTGSVKEEDGGLKEKITDGIETVKNIAETVRDVVDAIRNFSKMSKENKEEMLADLISNSIKTALDASKYIVDLIKDVPILGGIIGLIKNAITFFQKGFEIYHAEKRKKAMKEARHRLKEKMLKRREKYAGDEDLKDMGLYTQVERGADGGAHMTAAQKKQDKKDYGRERRGMDGQAGGQNRDIMRRNAARRKEDPAAKKAYYGAKARESQAQYDEMKEASYRSKNIVREAILDIIQEGVSVVENIASFVPGVGTVVKAGAKAVNTGTGLGRKGAAWIHSSWKEFRNNPRSETNKAKFRAKYAENVYSSLADVSQFVNTDGGITIDDTKLDEVKRVEDSYNFAETLLGGVGADMPALINSESKDELLDNMSAMFAREG